MAEKSGGKKEQSSPPKKDSKKEQQEQDDPTDGEKKFTVLESHGFRLGRTIGSGSYGIVKVAESENYDGLVAIKIISKHSAPVDYLTKFLSREIEVVRGLSHPNLIKFHQAIETSHRVYIVMEYAENGSLLDIIKRENHIDEPRAKVWFKELIDAVEYCHSQGVVHRDVKCENLLLDSGNHIKLSDFGFARGNMGTIEKDYVLTDTFCGSYAYASPEILKGIPYKPQYSDIWSSGVVLYAIVIGQLPFDDSNISNLIKQVQSPIKFPRGPEISPECRNLIRKILAPLHSRLKIAGIRQELWLQIDNRLHLKSAAVMFIALREW